MEARKERVLENADSFRAKHQMTIPTLELVFAQQLEWLLQPESTQESFISAYLINLTCVSSTSKKETPNPATMNARGLCKAANVLETSST